MSQRRLAGAVSVLPRFPEHRSQQSEVPQRPGNAVTYQVNDNDEDLLLSRMIPEPDYNTEEGLIVPRKLANPCVESSERRELHRELKFNNRIGKNVLNQKSELQKALEKHRELQSKKDSQLEKNTTRNSLEKVLQERARRLEQLEKCPDSDENQKSQGSTEFLRMHAKLRGRVEPTIVP